MLAPQPECFANVVQDFLVCTTIHKARQLGVFQSSIYVRVALDKMIRHTKNCENTENPYYNEYFVFEMKCTLMDLLHLTILYEIKKQTACKKNQILAELLIDLQSVWDQPNRCFFKKWGRLETPIGQSGGVGDVVSQGYLQIDLAIISKATNPHTVLKPYEDDLTVLNKWHIHQDYDDIERNLLQNMDAAIPRNIRYTITFYRGVMTKKSDYVIQFRFHPFKGKTNIARNTQEPSWNHEICFVWCYPALAQTLNIQLMMHEHLKWKCVAEYELRFNEIAFKDKPALGPSFINLYDNINGSCYVGRLLLSIKSERLESESHHVMTVKQVTALDETHYWKDEQFSIEFLAMQGDFIHCNSNNCSISLKLAEHNSNCLDIALKDYLHTFKKGQQPLKIFKHFSQPPPFKSITLKLQLPDNHIKYEGDVFLQEIIDYIKSEVELFKLFQVKYAGHDYSQLKVLKSIVLAVLQKMEHVMENKRLECRNVLEATEWDINRSIYLKDYFNKMIINLVTVRSKLKRSIGTYIELVIDEVVSELLKFSNRLQYLVSGAVVQDAWPDLILLLLANGKEFGFCKLNAKNFLFTSKSSELSNNSHCWKMRNFIFKDVKCQHTCINCGCTVGIIRGCLSIVTDTQTSDFLSKVVQQWTHSEPFFWSPHIPFVTFKCRLFIHQAKIRPGADRSGLCDAYLRVMICQCAAETVILFSTLSPIWNTVVSIDNIQLPGDFPWYLKNPPLAAIEVYDTNKGTADDYLGSGFLPLSVIKSDWVEWYASENKGADSEALKNKHAIRKYQLLKYSTPPPLKWIPVALAGVIRAEVLISGELVESEEVGSEISSKSTTTVGIPNAIKPNMKNYVMEAVFAGFRNYRNLNYLSSKHCVKVMMGELVLVSGITTTPIRNSMNFLILYASGIVSLPEQLEYWPAIIATDVEITSKSKETIVGATLIANSKRFLQKDKAIPCYGEGDSNENDAVSTTIQLETESDNENELSESIPLLNDKSGSSFWQSILNKFRSTTQIESSSEEDEDINDILDDREYNWWTKFYNSDLIESCTALSSLKQKLCIYHRELETQPEFSYLNDWAETVSMIHGVRHKKDVLPKEEIYATLKLHLKITPCICGRTNAGGGNREMLQPLATALNPRYQSQLQSLADLVKVVVRVYIVQGIQLRPSTENIQADAYVKVQLGYKLITNRAEYIPHQSNPVFGQCFQLEGLLPREHILEISVFNRKVQVKDETIGSTFIDLEDRWRSKHRATVGIANEYSSTGYNKWHDSMLPSEILSDMCKSYDLRAPKITDDTIEVDGVSFKDDTQIATHEDLQERLCLTALKNFENLPSFRYKLVPEHVETRSLYRKEYPGIEQGKIQLWIELFDGNLSIPPPIDITPHPPEMYELRVIVYNVSGVVLDEKNVFGKAMSDIYVKGWCSNFNEAQSTDVHFRSTNGEGNFNWRMLFPLKYSRVEDMMVTKRVTTAYEEYELKRPPILHLQIWDNDFISADDFLGTLEINLSGFPEPYKKAKDCVPLDVTQSISSYGATNTTVSRPKSRRKLLNLFKLKKIRGWFPVRGNIKDVSKSGEIGMAGKIDLELEVLTEAEGKANPAGLGRKGPQYLPEPKRPKTSFNPLTRPWKSARYAIFPHLVKPLLILLFLFILALVILQLVGKLPIIMTGLGF